MASSFDQTLSNWDTSKVKSLESTFKEATSFNQPLSDWDVDSVTRMSEMLSGATAFRQEKFCGTWSDNMATQTDMFKDVIKGSIADYAFDCTCTCDHGIAASGNDCTLDQASICASCSPGYALSIEKTCVLPCPFNLASHGTFEVPATGCRLNQMITLGSGDVMNISGNAIATPLYELKAVGGAPTPIEPKRHFEVQSGATLRLSYVKLTGGTVVSTLTSQSVGGSILAWGAGALVELVSCVFTGCNTDQACARMVEFWGFCILQRPL